MLTLLLVFLVGCGGQTTTGASWDDEIECLFNNGIGGPEHVEVIDTLLCTDPGQPGCSPEGWSSVYGDWTVRVTLTDSPSDIPSIAISVTPTGLDEGMSVSVLYQLIGPPKDVSTHGFTGLHYIHHPQTGEVFQVLCTD